MYWIPIVFIVFEIIYISMTSELMKFSSATTLNTKYKNHDLTSYIKNKYLGYGWISLFIVSVMFLEFIYFVIGLTKPIFYFSLVYLLYIIVANVVNQLIKKRLNSISRLVKLSELDDFETDDVKFQRMLKINELEGGVKVYRWMWFMPPLFKLGIFVAIVLMHYKLGIL